jgi:hypothetical protein
MSIGRATKVFLAVAVVSGVSVGMAAKTDGDLARSLCGSRVAGSQVSASWVVVTNQGSTHTEITCHG